MGDARGEHTRLAGAGAGKHEKRPVERLDRLALLGVERVEIVARAPAHGALRGGELVLLGRGQGGFRSGGANLCHGTQNYTIGRGRRTKEEGAGVQAPALKRLGACPEGPPL